MATFVKVFKKLTFAPVKNITFNFDPFRPNVRSIREVLYLLSAPKHADTNADIKLKYNVKNDRSEPTMEVTFKDEHKVIFKTENLSPLEILYTFNQFCDERLPKDQKANDPKT